MERDWDWMQILSTLKLDPIMDCCLNGRKYMRPGLFVG